MTQNSWSVSGILITSVPRVLVVGIFERVAIHPSRNGNDHAVCLPFAHIPIPSTNKESNFTCSHFFSWGAYNDIALFCSCDCVNVCILWKCKTICGRETNEKVLFFFFFRYQWFKSVLSHMKCMRVICAIAFVHSLGYNRSHTSVNVCADKK